MTPELPPSDEALALLAHRARQALPDAPPALLHAALGLWHAAPIVPASAPLAAALRRVAAVLRFDSWSLPAQAQGMRGVAADWGPFRNASKRADMINWTRSQPFCQPQKTARVSKAVARRNHDNG